MVYSRSASVRFHLAERSSQICRLVDFIHQAVPSSSFHSLFQSRQHAFCPDLWFDPRPASGGRFLRVVYPCSTASRGRELCPVFFRRSFHFASTFLRPANSQSSNAPRELPRFGNSSEFHATMNALTPARLSLSGQVSLVHSFVLPTLPPPTTRRFLLSLSHASLQRNELPVCWPTTAGTSCKALHGSGFRLSLTGSPITSGRITFVILRTGRLPPVASHPVSRQRSYSRLQVWSVDLMGTCTPLDAVLPGALGIGRRAVPAGRYVSFLP